MVRRLLDISVVRDLLTCLSTAGDPLTGFFRWFPRTDLSLKVTEPLVTTELPLEHPA